MDCAVLYPIFTHTRYILAFSNNKNYPLDFGMGKRAKHVIPARPVVVVQTTDCGEIAYRVLTGLLQSSTESAQVLVIARRTRLST
jgi:hypothetical protein